MGRETNSGLSKNPTGSPRGKPENGQTGRPHPPQITRSRPRPPGPDERLPARSGQRRRVATEAAKQQEEGSTVTTGATPAPRTANRAGAPGEISSDSDNETTRDSDTEVRALTQELDNTTSPANISRLRTIITSYTVSRSFQRRLLNLYTSRIEQTFSHPFFPPRPIIPDRNFRFTRRSAPIVSGFPIGLNPPFPHLTAPRPVRQPTPLPNQRSVEENMESAWLAKTRISLQSWYIHEYNEVLEQRNDPARFKARLTKFRDDLEAGAITRVDLDSFDDS